MTDLEMCAELSRAMGWTLVYHGSGISPDSTTVPQPRKAPNPFTSAEDSRSLVEWLRTQSGFIQDRFNTAIVRAVTPYGMTLKATEALTAPLPTIARAAYDAIKEKP